MLKKTLDWVKTIPLIQALLLLVIANIALLGFDPIKKIDVDSLPAIRTWVWWATHDFKKRERSPDVVYIGSSVMMHPTWWQEAAYRNQDVDLVADHTSHYAEDMIAKHTGINNLSCFNFGLPGAVPSDQYMIVKALLDGKRKPKLAVIGMVPRDLVDNHFGHAGSSRHYRYLSRFVDCSKLEALAVPNWWDRPQYWVNDYIYFKGESQPIQQVVRHAAEQWLAPVLKSLPASPLDRVTDEDRKFAMHRAELEKGVWVAHPTTPYVYVAQADIDCLNRYATPNDPLFENQKTWLDMTLGTLKEREIPTIVVNMPVTSLALRCMKDGVYDRHVNTLERLATKYGFDFFDAQKTGKFVPQDFTDWAHMDASGGEKLHDLIGEFISKKQYLVAQLSSGGTAVADDSTRPSVDRTKPAVATKDQGHL